MRPAFPENGTRWGIAAIASTAIPAAAVFVWRESWWPEVLFIAWVLAAFALYTAWAKRKWTERSIRMLDHARLSAIRTLSHHRHDWMNDLQILYGYLRLNKPDKAVQIVDRIRERMENDSKVSQLGNAELSTYLLSFRTICDHIRLDVNVGEGVGLDRLPVDADKLAAGLIGLINAIRYRAAPSSAGENVLRVSFVRTEEALRVELVYEGEWSSGQSLAGEAESLLHGLGRWTEVKEDGEGARGGARRMLVTFPLTALRS